MSGLGIALLAAGSASRFGGGKLDAMLDGTPVGRHALNLAAGLEAARLAIVVAERVPDFAISAADVALLRNERAGDGIGHSVARAAGWARETRCETLLLILADMPLIRLETLRALIAATEGDRPAAVRYPDGRAGVPACFPESWFARLEALGGERGAASLLQEADPVAFIDAQPAELRDIDTRADLAGIDSALKP